jgi:hypothetical protein
MQQLEETALPETEKQNGFYSKEFVKGIEGGKSFFRGHIE